MSSASSVLPSDLVSVEVAAQQVGAHPQTSLTRCTFPVLYPVPAPERGPRWQTHAQRRNLGTSVRGPPWGRSAALGSGRLGPPWGQTEFQVNLKLGLTSHACIQSPGHSQDGPSNHAPTRSVCTAAAVASLRARFSHSCGINVSLASLGRYARTCERYHGLFSPGSRPTGSSQTLSVSPTGLRASWACGLMVLGATKC